MILMNYKGKLFGKVGGEYFDTGKTSADWDALHMETKWISVKDRLPDPEDYEVLAVDKYQEYLVGHVCNANIPPYGIMTICEAEDQMLQEVTHWMPLPEPPKND